MKNQLLRKPSIFLIRLDLRIAKGIAAFMSTREREERIMQSSSLIYTRRVLTNTRSVLISIGTLCVTVLILACAEGFDLDDAFYSFFAPETSHTPAYSPFYRSLHFFYNLDKNDNISDFNSKNTEEWTAWLGREVKTEDVDYLLYRCKAGDLDALLNYFTPTQNNLPNLSSFSILSPNLERNTILKIEDKSSVREFLRYLKYAKSCEHYATYKAGGSWEPKDTANDLKLHPKIAMRLIEEGNNELLISKVNFIQQRYLFQIIRLYFLSGNPEACISFYQSHLAAHTVGMNENNSCSYRTMGYAAGALYQLKRFGEANYLYALIYDNCDLMKVSACSGFHPQEERDWQECLGRAKNRREKEVLWQLLGFSADPLRAMKEIYALEPSSDLLDLLLVRGMNMEEEKFLPLKNSYEKPVDSTYHIKSSALNKEFAEFVTTTANEMKTSKPYLWDLSAGYLAIVQGDFKSGDTWLGKASHFVSGDTLVQQQIRLLEIVSKIEQEQAFKGSFEGDIVKDLVWMSHTPSGHGLRNTNVYQWALKRLGEKYKARGDIVKAHCLNPESDHSFYASSEKMKRMLEYMDKSVKTPFDQYILGIYPYKKTDIYEFQAVNLLYQYKLKEAAMKFDECPGSGDAPLSGDPFVIHIKDCHDCDHAMVQPVAYTKRRFVKKMLDLENDLKSYPINAADDYYEMANGYYNMTYFGNARLLYQTKIKSYSGIYWEYWNTFPALWDQVSDIPKSSAIVNCKKAEEYYMKAMESYDDVEFQAKCNFMAAKAEQNSFIIAKPKEFKGDFKAGIYFNNLKNSYKETKYYSEIINECGYFKTFDGK